MPYHKAVRKIDQKEGISLARAAVQGGLGALSSTSQKTLARFLLEEMAARHPGHSVEIRIPFTGATQAISGLHHRRGTPPNVVELATQTWIALCLGLSSWDSEIAAGSIDASGTRADLSPYLPLLHLE